MLYLSRLTVLALTLCCGFAAAFPIIFPRLVVSHGAYRIQAVAPGSFIALAVELGSPLDGDRVNIRLTAADGQTYLLPAIEPPQKSSKAVWAAIPPDAALGPAIISASTDGSSNGQQPIQIVRAAPGIFTLNYLGYGPAIALNRANFRIGLTTAAIPSQEISLFATGLGDASTPDVIVEIGGQPVQVLYAGPQGTPGLDQINVIVPEDAARGCYVPVTIRVRGVTSNLTTLAVNPDPNVCAHPLGLAYSDLKTLDSGGTVPLGRLSIGGNYSESGASEGASLFFLNLNASDAYRASGAQMPPEQYFSCLALGETRDDSFINDTSISFKAKLTGPNGRQMEVPSFNPVPTDPSPFFTRGSWEFSSDSGTRTEFTMPPPLRVSSLGFGATFSADADLSIIWDGSAYGANDVATLKLWSADSEDFYPECHVRAQDGKILVPGELLTRFRGRRIDARLSIHALPATRPLFSVDVNGTRIPVLVDFNFLHAVEAYGQ